jgi:hypothetical protein
VADASKQNQTKSASINQVLALLEGLSGSDNYIPRFNVEGDVTTLVNSVMLQNEDNSVSVAGDLNMGSNGIFIGGTSEDNKLDDYEEGTFDPTLVTTGTSTDPITKQGRYTKIGNIVTVTIMVSVNVAGGATLSLVECSNLPFLIRNESSFAGIRLRGVAGFDNAITDAFELYSEGIEGTLRLLFRKGGSSIALNDNVTNNLVMAQITYEV